MRIICTVFAQTFLPRDVMHSADYAVARCLSVWPSVRPSDCHTPVFCRKGSTYHQTFSRSSHTTLVFPYQTLWQYSNGDSPAWRGRRTQGGMKKSRFLTTISLYLRTDTKHRHSYYGVGAGNLTHLSNAIIFNDLERPLIPISRSRYYLMLNTSTATVRDTDIVSVKYLQERTPALLKCVISNDLEWPWVTYWDI